MYFRYGFVNLLLLVFSASVSALDYVASPDSLPEVKLKPKIRNEDIDTSGFYTIKLVISICVGTRSFDVNLLP